MLGFDKENGLGRNISLGAIYISAIDIVQSWVTGESFVQHLGMLKDDYIGFLLPYLEFSASVVFGGYLSIRNVRKRIRKIHGTLDGVLDVSKDILSDANAFESELNELRDLARNLNDLMGQDTETKRIMNDYKDHLESGIGKALVGYGYFFKDANSYAPILFDTLEGMRKSKMMGPDGYIPHVNNKMEGDFEVGFVTNKAIEKAVDKVTKFTYISEEHFFMLGMKYMDLFNGAVEKSRVSDASR